MPDAFADRVMDIIAAAQEIPRDQIAIDDSFEDLGIDSLDGIALIGDLEDEFGVQVPNTEALSITTVREAVEKLRARVAEQEG